ncbi:MAG: GNAT family N-acetyltransferase [Nocardioidaceae bacterium]|nr:GNAT family N-acetyltransferase [Nocardioidaceae bacterium]
MRPITRADFAAVLAWNEDHVELLAPLTEERLVTLIGWADTAAVIAHEGRDAGFVLTFAAGSDYDSPNFRWFAERYPSFVYLDRIVVDPAFRRTGLGTRVYDELEAAAGTPVFCLEVNSDPPNEPSLAFHRHRGYVEVGTLPFAGHEVMLFEKPLR